MASTSLSICLRHTSLPPSFLLPVLLTRRTLSTTTSRLHPTRDRPTKSQRLQSISKPSSRLTFPTPDPSPPSPGPQVLHYHVSRTPSNQLPVYHLAKGGGGNQHLTRIRKITGDVRQLRDDLRRVLGLREDWIWVNGMTGQVIIKGWVKAEVSKFLEERQF